jgi:MSHA biogenesis protein MshG
MGRQTANPVLKNAIRDIALAIESGAGLHEAMAAFPDIFDQLFINVVTIGEESGNLDQAFLYLAELLENEKAVREKIRSATRYPKIVVTAIFIAVFILMSFVVPKFASLYAASHVALPLPTRILLGISGFFAAHYKAIAAAVVLAVFGFRELKKRPESRIVLDRLVLRVPVFGDLAVKIYMSRFCRVFALLTKSGIDVIKTLTLSAAALDNMVLRERLRRITADVREGSDLFSAFSRHEVFPEMVSQMLAIGEESGRTDTMMSKVADYYDMDTDYTIKNLATLIEPFLLLFLGVMVAFIALSIFLPIWNLMSVMRGG